MLVKHFTATQPLPEVAYGRSLGLNLKKKLMNDDFASEDLLLPLKNYLQKGWFERPRGPKFSIYIHEEGVVPTSVRRTVRKSIREELTTPVITNSVLVILKRKIKQYANDVSLDERNLRNLWQGDRLLRILLCDYPAYSLRDVYAIQYNLYRKLDCLFVLDTTIKEEDEFWVADIHVRRILDNEINLQYTKLTIPIWNLGMTLDWLMKMLVFY